MDKITQFTCRAVVLPAENIDTDQIIPARFLKITDKLALGEHLFTDWRYDAQGNPRPEFPLNRPEAAGAEILIAGNNFGCGSSREHAPWALRSFGFRAILSTSFADIFRNNALKNGLLPIVLEPQAHRGLMDLVTKDSNVDLTVDLASQTVTEPDGRRHSFPLDAFSKVCLLNGIDELGYLLKHEVAIRAFESAHPAWVSSA